MESRGRGMYGADKKKPRKPINKRKLVGAAVALGILLSVLFVANYGVPALSFRREGIYPTVPRSDVFLWLTDLQDCILDVSFIDDSDLIYRLDIELFNPSFAASAFEMTVDDTWDGGGDQVSVRFNALVPIRRVQLVLGSATPYDIMVSGLNVTGTFVFGNNMKGSDTDVAYSATGAVNMTFTEDMEFLENKMEVSIGALNQGRPDYAYVNVDMIEGLNGVIGFTGPFSLHTSTGWEHHTTFFEHVTYRTTSYDSFNKTALEIGIHTEQMAHAWLSD